MGVSMSSSASALVRRHWLDTLLLLVPVGLALEAYGGDPLWVFGAAGLAIVPLAGWMGRATEHLASRLGEGIGGLLNATFGNAAELIIALFALREGLHEVVKASITAPSSATSSWCSGSAWWRAGCVTPCRTSTVAPPPWVRASCC